MLVLGKLSAAEVLRETLEIHVLLVETMINFFEVKIYFIYPVIIFIFAAHLAIECHTKKLPDFHIPFEISVKNSSVHLKIIVHMRNEKPESANHFEAKMFCDGQRCSKDPTSYHKLN